MGFRGKPQGCGEGVRAVGVTDVQRVLVGARLSPRAPTGSASSAPGGDTPSRRVGATDAFGAPAVEGACPLGRLVDYHSICDIRWTVAPKEDREHLAPYLEHLRELPFVRAARVARREPRDGEGRWDAELVLTTPVEAVTFWCEHKRSHLTKEIAERVAHQARGTENVLLLAPTVGRELGEFLRREGVNFVDLAGNCYVRVRDQYIARIQGMRAASVPAMDRPLRSAAYRVLFALLVDPSLLGASVRAVAAKAGGVSPQTVADLRARLVEQGMMLRARGRARWSPSGRRQALDLWIAGFSATLSPNLIVGRFRAREREVEALEARLTSSLGHEGAWRWGGGAAAQRLTRYYRGDRTVVYLASDDAALPKRLALVRDAAGPLVLMRTPGPLAFESPQADTVHPLLVYADLLAEGHDRARDAARVVFEKYLQHEEVSA